MLQSPTFTSRRQPLPAVTPRPKHVAVTDLYQPSPAVTSRYSSPEACCGHRPLPAVASRYQPLPAVTPRLDRLAQPHLIRHEGAPRMPDKEGDTCHNEKRGSSDVAAFQLKRP